MPRPTAMNPASAPDETPIALAIPSKPSFKAEMASPTEWIEPIFLKKSVIL